LERTIFKGFSWEQKVFCRSIKPLGVLICRTDQVALQARLSLRFLGDSMTKRLISSGSTFEEQIGYSRAVVVGDWVFVSGTTGFDYKTMSISESLVQQTEQCLKNIESALQQADSSLKDVVRVTYVLPDGADFEQCWPVLRKYFGEVRPAAMMISAGLADPRMKIEIEVTALKRS
jgi:enamine deaminase RidA (YjgF/YER057c/UK114 family)